MFTLIKLLMLDKIEAITTEHADMKRKGTLTKTLHDLR